MEGDVEEDSFYGFEFNDEHTGHKHDVPYLLTMHNNNQHQDGSKFEITFAPMPEWDGKRVVFG